MQKAEKKIQPVRVERTVVEKLMSLSILAQRTINFSQQCEEEKKIIRKFCLPQYLPLPYPPLPTLAL